MGFEILQLGKRNLSESEVNRVLPFGIDNVIDISKAERGMIILFDAEGDILFETARNLNKQDIKDPEFEISRTIIDKVKDQKQSYFTHNALEEGSLQSSESVFRLKILSVICLPLIFDDKIFGVVYLDNRKLHIQFTVEIFDFLKEITDFISLAAYQALEKIRRHAFLSKRSDTINTLRSKICFAYYNWYYLNRNKQVDEAETKLETGEILWHLILMY